VHAIELYSSAELERVQADSNGHVCGMLPGVSPEQTRSRRIVLVGALLTAISPLMAQSGRVRFRVTDPTGAVIPGAAASLLGQDETTMETHLANSVGEVAWTDLPIGNSRFMVVSAGFKKRIITVTVRNNDELSVDVALEVGEAIMGIFLESSLKAKKSPIPTQTPGSELKPENLPPNHSVSAPAPKPAKRKHWLIFHW